MPPSTSSSLRKPLKQVSEKELQQVARQYENEGYSVAFHPKDDQLPTFAAGYEVELLVRRGRQNALVAVAANRTALAARPTLVKLAELANSQPGWRFDFMVLGAETYLDRIAYETGEPSTEQIEGLLARAERAASAGDKESACVFAWAGLEATMRRAAEELDRNGNTKPIDLLGRLSANGIFSEDQYEQLRKAFSMRTRVVHGYPSAEVDASTVANTVSVARKLLQAELQKAPAAGV